MVEYRKFVFGDHKFLGAVGDECISIEKARYAYTIIGNNLGNGATIYMIKSYHGRPNGWCSMSFS